jgi:uncharacterized protein YegP (UPF0339 family)
MAGMFEVFVDAESLFRFRLIAPDGTVMAVSKAFDDKPAAVAGITAVREYAGMGLIADLCPGTRPNHSAATARAGSVPQARDEQRTRADDFRAPARPLRRFATGPRWTGAA